MTRRKENIFTLFLIICLSSTGLSFPVLSRAAVYRDAIAIRVIPNSEHLSAFRWYLNQGFTGSPQTLIVDGYEAVRDGRTVYVNAANIDTNNNAFYTNIYLISYNQEAEPATIDIFGRVLSHWKFNTNLVEVGNCSLSAIICRSSGDCPSNYSCSENNKCLPNSLVKCMVDSNCPNNIYCDSDKAKATRDTKRLADLREIKLFLDSYKKNYGFYPNLTAGTYLPNLTLSVWPSWQETFASALNQGQLPIDPINRLGKCPANYSETTGWDEIKKEFADPNPADGLFEAPAESKLYIYQAAAGALSYDICGYLESDSLAEDSNGCH